jgi:streptomycin 6-kinase
VDLLPPGLPVLTNLAGVPAAQDWLRQLPGLITAVRDEFALTLQPPLHGGSCSWVAPATLPDGTPVIVKIAWPHPEMLTEPAALRAWNGNGAVRLLRHDPARHALLLTPCLPGTELAHTAAPAEERLRIGCEVLRRLWAAPPTDDFDHLTDVTATWAALAGERMERLRPDYDPGLVTEGINLLRTLPLEAGREVLLHGDCNPGNILFSTEEGWQAIDPKPMRGDAAYDPWPLLQQIDSPFSYAFPATQLRSRLKLLAHELNLKADRLAAWAVAREVEKALDMANIGDPVTGARAIAQARILANL